jgi:hypothetical protein
VWVDNGEKAVKRAGYVPWVLLSVLLVILLLVVFAAVVLMPPARALTMNIKQKAQFAAMDAAIELFRSEYGSYLPSDANDPTGKPYCGAMKLAEAMMGQDLQGFHWRSAFRCDGLDPDSLTSLYPANPPADNLNARRGPYMSPEYANAWRLADVYGKGKTGPFHEDAYVLCDIHIRKRPGGQETGMPILYYRADRSGSAHRPGDPNNIYDFRDNRELLALGVPGQPGKAHPLIDPNRFYLNTRDPRIDSSPHPHRADSCILISAGQDSLYGTADDVCNFEWKYRQE